MLCAKCQKREATIHLTQIVGEKMTKRDLCEVCGKEFADMARSGGYIPFDAIAPNPAATRLDLVVASDPRYRKEAYHFVREALSMVQKRHWNPGVPRHISGADLLDGLRGLAIESFGNRAKAQLNKWGIFKCEDFGEIIFNLVEAGLLAKQPEDTKADFQGGYDFDTAFPT